MLYSVWDRVVFKVLFKSSVGEFLCSDTISLKASATSFGFVPVNGRVNSLRKMSMAANIYVYFLSPLLDGLAV